MCRMPPDAPRCLLMPPDASRGVDAARLHHSGGGTETLCWRKDEDRTSTILGPGKQRCVVASGLDLMRPLHGSNTYFRSARAQAVPAINFGDRSYQRVLTLDRRHATVKDRGSAARTPVQ